MKCGMQLLISTVMLLCSPVLALRAAPSPETPKNGRTITLEQAYDRALASEQSILKAYIEIRKAKLQQWSSLTPVFPSITATVSKSKSGSSSYTPAGGSGDTSYSFSGTTHSHSDSVSPGINYRQTLLDFTVIPGWRQARLNTHESRLTYQHTVRTVLYDLARAYYDVLKQKQILTVSRESLKLAEAQLDIAQKRANAGEALRSDVLNARVTVETNRQFMIEAENTLASSLSTLSKILNLPWDFEYQVVDPPNYPQDVPAYSKLLQRAMTSREDLQALALVIDKNLEGRKKVLAQYAPSVAAEANAFIENTNGTTSSRQSSWNASIYVEIPISTGGQREIDLRNSVYLIDQARLDYESQAKTVEQEVKDSWLNVRTQKAYIQSLTVQVEAARQAYEDIQNQYKAGTSTSIEVLAALNSLNESRRDLAGRIYDYQVALRQLEASIGVFQDSRVRKLNTR
ncbi:hypothetical protein DB346_01275 [Verrucomicrobia bacterium LW23]|nr:hypothetical protein DB346_01275 [Verrucomicrobia bacterium LW23]